MVERTLIDEWRWEVANGDTLLGFEEWLAHKREAEDTEPRGPE